MGWVKIRLLWDKVGGLQGLFEECFPFQLLSQPFVWKGTNVVQTKWTRSALLPLAATFLLAVPRGSTTCLAPWAKLAEDEDIQAEQATREKNKVAAIMQKLCHTGSL